jgi:hypothetical protein
MPVSAGRYVFSTGVSALFEMPTSDARRILPEHLEPVEVRHQRSILAVNAFHFLESEVGPYAELMFSVVVPPVPGSWWQHQHPKAGFYPFLAATSSEESRKHRSERYRIPHLAEDIDARFVEMGGALQVSVWTRNGPVVDLTVTQHKWESTTHLLHTFMMDGTQRLKANLQISGRYTVHENERGRMTLHRHPMTTALTLEEISPYPFREHWLKEGVELFHPLETLPG